MGLDHGATRTGRRLHSHLLDRSELARQLEAIGQVNRVFEDKVSGGGRKDRAWLLDRLGYVREGGTVRVVSIDRLARSMIDLQ